MGYDEMIKKLWSIIDSKNTDDKDRIKRFDTIFEIMIFSFYHVVFGKCR